MHTFYLIEHAHSLGSNILLLPRTSEKKNAALAAAMYIRMACIKIRLNMLAVVA